MPKQARCERGIKAARFPLVLVCPRCWGHMAFERGGAHGEAACGPRLTHAGDRAAGVR